MSFPSADGLKGQMPARSARFVAGYAGYPGTKADLRN
jgi:hypothetical protein